MRPEDNRQVSDGSGQSAMKHNLVCLGVALALLAGAAAQERSAFDGKWQGSFTDLKGRPRRAELAVEGRGGTWTYAREGGKWDNGCAGAGLPIVVDELTAAELRFHIDGEKVLKGCGERRVWLKLVEGNQALEGSFADNGHAIKMTRR
jgi:hypothetical protein